ncbi:MAG: hypothetical protein ACRETC_06115 [Gammaproteobacteria bacterium]
MTMPDISPEKQKAYEARLQRRLKILKNKFEASQVHIAEGLEVIESLKRVRYTADGSVDLSTVDGLVRSMALAVEAMHDREEMKKSASLAEIQTAYYQFLEQNFGKFFNAMVERKLTPHDVGMSLSRIPSAVEELIRNLPGFLQVVDEFWASAGPIAIAHVEDQRDSLKGVFGGDLFPSPYENIASKCSLYTDTLVLPDPFLRSKQLFEQFSDEKKVYYMVKHALNLLQYRDLACAEISPPIVVILPDMSVLDEAENAFFYNLAEVDAVLHGTKIFGRQFGSFNEMLEFCGELDTIERVTAKVVDRERVLFDTEWEGPLETQFLRAKEDPTFAGMLKTKNPGLIVALQAMGRMSAANELLVKARRLQGVPIMDAPTSWQYLVWKMEYDAVQAAQAKNLKDLHTIRGLQNLSENKMRWLGRIPPDALIEIRKDGALSEIREILTSGIEELAMTDSKGFQLTSSHIFDNIQSAFEAHQKKIDILVAKRWKFAGSDIGSWLVVGSLFVVAAATQSVVWALASYSADQILAPPKLRTIPKTLRKLAEEDGQLKRSPVGMLFNISKG